MDEILRQRVWDRAQGACEYCHIPQRFDILPFQIDHIIAQKHHGPTVGENLALCCYSDNSYKGPNIAGIDPYRGEVTRLFHPRRDVWDEHFQWDGILRHDALDHARSIAKLWEQQLAALAQVIEPSAEGDRLAFVLADFCNGAYGC